MRALSQLKLCFLAGTLEHGGAERQLFYILQALCRTGAAPRLLSLDRGEFWEERIKALGVRVTWAGDQPSRLKRLLRVLKELRQDPPDVVQSQHFYANAYAGLAARLLRAGGIGALRSNGHSEVSESGRLGGWLNLHCPRMLAANSQLAIQYAVAHGVPARQLYFLPNVVDTDWFRPATHPSNGTVTLIAVGRLVKEKRLDRFLAILARLTTGFHLNVRGLIVGPGCQDEDLRPELENQARQLGLSQDIVQFRGGVPDTRSVYREAAVCVLTSDYEGTPNVLLEAMACGLPVVASNVGGVPGIVQDGQTGFLLEPDNLEGFTAALAGLVKNAALRTEMGRRARSYVAENHSLHRLPAFLEELYGQALPKALAGGFTIDDLRLRSLPANGRVNCKS
ncbi:MAG: glycosyltransferase family 4 protein [Verrucomicrobiota bacterium]|nr:glycosyltransferase family 4 protein [Verrucomicrobiota bacterium]